VGWLVSGDLTDLSSTRCNAIVANSELPCSDGDMLLQRFWGTVVTTDSNDESSTPTFLERQCFCQGRYEVGLPWKESHSAISDHFTVCLNHLGLPQIAFVEES